MTQTDVLLHGTNMGAKTSLREAILKQQLVGEKAAEDGGADKYFNFPFVRSHLGAPIKTRVGIPSPLWCSSVILEDGLSSTHHNLFPKDASLPMRMMQEHSHQV